MAAELSGHAPKDGDGHEYRQSRICGQLFGSRTGDDQPLGRLVDSFGCLEEVFNSNSFDDVRLDLLVLDIFGLGTSGMS